MERVWTTLLKTVILQSQIAILLGAMLFALCLPVEAQQPTKIPRIGYVSGTGSSLRSWAVRRGVAARAARSRLRRGEKLRNRVSRRGGKTGPLPKPGERTRTTQSRCSCRPYFTGNPRSEAGDQNDPHRDGDQYRSSRGRLVDSLARPGGNITGLSTLAQDLSGKRLELLTEVVPRLSRVAVLRDVGQSKFGDCV